MSKGYTIVRDVEGIECETSQLNPNSLKCELRDLDDQIDIIYNIDMIMIDRGLARSKLSRPTRIDPIEKMTYYIDELIDCVYGSVDFKMDRNLLMCDSRWNVDSTIRDINWGPPRATSAI